MVELKNFGQGGEQKRNIAVQVRMTKEEKELAEEKAKQLDMSISELIRQLIISLKVNEK